MHQLQRARVQNLQPYARLAEVIHLLEETPEVDATFMIHKHFAYETYGKPCIAYSYAQVDILAHHILEIAHRIVHLFGKTHIECARTELFHHRLAASYAARCPEGCHCVAHRLLHIGEGGIGSIGAAKAIEPVCRKGRFEPFKIEGRENNVGIEEEQVVAGRTRHTVVARVATPRILLIMVMDGKKRTIVTKQMVTSFF